MPWALPQDEQSLLALAKSYPFDAPDDSFLFRKGAAAPIAAADFSGRTGTQHSRFLASVFRYLAEGGTLPDDCIARDIDRLCRYFNRQGLDLDPIGLAHELWEVWIG